MGEGDEYFETFIHFRGGVSEGNRDNAVVPVLINKKYKTYITNWNFIKERAVLVEFNISARSNAVGI
jgi:hypothetical protein